MPAASVPFEKCFEFCLNRGSVLNRPVWSSLGGMDLLNFRSSRVLESCVINPSDWPQEKQGKHCHISETYFIATHVEICSLKSDLLHHITNCDSAKANLSGQSLMHLAPRFADDTIFLFLLLKMLKSCEYELQLHQWLISSCAYVPFEEVVRLRGHDWLRDNLEILPIWKTLTNMDAKVAFEQGYMHFIGVSVASNFVKLVTRKVARQKPNGARKA
jgi:hypothetical protein